MGPKKHSRVFASPQTREISSKLLLLKAELLEEVLDAGGLLLGLDVLLVQVPLLEDLPQRLANVRGGGLDGRLIHGLLEVDVHLVPDRSVKTAAKGEAAASSQSASFRRPPFLLLNGQWAHCARSREIAGVGTSRLLHALEDIA